ncbi:hypothetical protein [Nocardia mexicana]|uniref:hypothetical protein n=1 Tax=Nocardia mexicana TaxID=279262 RepID=UPI0011C04441|nr:hypothetical protein [Nocardia mexicana]
MTAPNEPAPQRYRHAPGSRSHRDGFACAGNPAETAHRCCERPAVRRSTTRRRPHPPQPVPPQPSRDSRIGALIGIGLTVASVLLLAAACVVTNSSDRTPLHISAGMDFIAAPETATAAGPDVEAP